MYTFNSMITGFNHNVKYRNRVFHVQTEDNGEKTPLIFTHLFEGGDILATKKIDYHMIVGKPNFEKQVRRMMEDQHKAMLKALMHGELDALIEAHDVAVGVRAHALSTVAAPAGQAAAASAVPPQPEAAVAPAPAVPAAPSEPVTAPVPIAATPAVARPTGGPRKGVTIFGESLISERTLDEVIINYLIDQEEDGEGEE